MFTCSGMQFQVLQALITRSVNALRDARESTKAINPDSDLCDEVELDLERVIGVLGEFKNTEPQTPKGQAVVVNYFDGWREEFTGVRHVSIYPNRDMGKPIARIEFIDDREAHYVEDLAIVHNITTVVAR